MLHREEDVEDAFQATFLVLVRKAASVRKQDSVRSWLYGVAQRVAARAREREVQRWEKEKSARPVSTDDTADATPWEELRPILDAEIARLPEKYRLPVILCYFDGQTNEEAAQQLGCPTGTVATRLARARERLRGRLVRRGVTLSVGALTAALSQNAAPAAVSGVLVSATVRTVVRYILGNATAGGGSTAAVALMEGVVRAMLMSKCKAVVAGVLALVVLAGGASMFHFAGRAQDPAVPKAPAPRIPADDDEKKKTDDAAKEAREKLEDLLKARRIAAEDEVKLREQEFLAAGTTAGVVLEAHRRLLKAELELAEKKEDRIKAHEYYLAKAEEIVKANMLRFKAGKINGADLKQSEYYRLEAEIELLREKTK
jgi:RNA polymerase sigma factor (sigma-70 family)